MEEDLPDELAKEFRSSDEAARRCLVLYAIVAAGHGESKTEIISWLRREELLSSISPKEQEFLFSENPTSQQKINATWRAEALLPLLWSLGLIAELPSPQQLCDIPLIRSVLPPLLGPVGGFISTACLREPTEIHDANEEIYQIHWRVRDARLRNQPPSPNQLPRMPATDVDPPVESYVAGVVQERHHSLNWLIGYCNQDWDDITTDT